LIRRKDSTEIELIRASGQIVFSVQQRIEALIAPGISTLALDEVAEAAIREAGARPAFKGYHGFPASICASVNASIVHGFPSDEPLAEGDIVSIDVGTELNGYYGDGAFTIGVGSISASAAHLIATTQQCLDLGIEQMCPDARLGDISHAIQAHAETAGYAIVREYGGHGIGRELHESPHINNYGHRGKGPRLKVGHVFCIEPILSAGSPEVEHEEDGWTVYTRDRSLTAHSEHTVAITESGPEILTLPMALQA
jgi:methionyl aminopeptidase